MIQRVNTEKDCIRTEYLSTELHSNNITDKTIQLSAMQEMKCTQQYISGNYTVHVELVETDENIMGEVREFLKKKYIEDKFGSMQIEPKAVQFLSQKGEEKP